MTPTLPGPAREALASEPDWTGSGLLSRRWRVRVPPEALISAVAQSGSAPGNTFATPLCPARAEWRRLTGPGSRGFESRPRNRFEGRRYGIKNGLKLNLDSDVEENKNDDEDGADDGGRGAAPTYDVGHGDRGASKTPAERVRVLHVVPAGLPARSCPRMHLVKQPDCRSGEGSSILLGGASAGGLRARGALPGRYFNRENPTLAR